MNENKELTLSEKLKTFTVSSLNFVASHRFILVIVIVGAALIFALLRTRSFIDIPRNETRYNEEYILINYKDINVETLERFKATDQDTKIEVNSNFDPNRQNPFTE
jgi:hypothetical protein